MSIILSIDAKTINTKAILGFTIRQFNIEIVQIFVKKFKKLFKKCNRQLIPIYEYAFILNEKYTYVSNL